MEEEDNFLKNVQKQIDAENKLKEDYRIQIAPDVLEYSNNILLHRYGSLMYGEYNTYKEEIEYKLVQDELYKRLQDCGFLRKEEGK